MQQYITQIYNYKYINRVLIKEGLKTVQKQEKLVVALW